ncbi:MAG: hypothetical protein WD491_09255, partial [Balneolales bacterium]
IDFPSSNPVEDQYMAVYNDTKNQLLTLMNPEEEVEIEVEEQPEQSKPQWHLAGLDLQPQVFSI